MKQKRIYVPVDESWLTLIKTLAIEMDRSEAWVSSQLVHDGVKFNMLEKYTLNPSTDIIAQFKSNH